ncbi:MAG TPA: apolipoprotein N-acyltransferase [Bacteroidales bacterium]|nr:apolipoprotein N-acyltransferase [Bacteroidales bacterium]
MKRLNLILLSLFTGLLLSLAWPAYGFPGLLFIALVPLLVVENHFYSNRQYNSGWALTPYAFLAFFVWNLLTTWWIANATVVGGVVAVVMNSVFMTGIFLLFHATHRIVHKPHQAWAALIFYWISFEYIHHHWDLNWPWLSLGNGFSSRVTWIQFYEYTGIFGGSLWVLMSNILLFKIVKLVREKELHRRIWLNVSLLLILIALPLLVSKFIYRSIETTNGDPVEVVVVQPNIDPYLEQYILPPLTVVDRIWSLAEQKTTPNTAFIVAPESAIQEYVWKDHINYTPSVLVFREHLRTFPRAQLVVGISARDTYAPDEEIPHTARKFRDTDIYYDRFNVAMILDTSRHFQLYNKSKLTPGVEMMPLSRWIRPIENLALDLGGTIGSLGTDPERIPFTTAHGIKVGTAICYESVFGEFMTGYVHHGANMIFVITNDGWWGDTPGHRQHLQFSSLRAIELRRAIARSANTGISCFVNKRGDILQPTQYWEQDVIRDKMFPNDEITFYVRHGDYIARVSAFGAVMMLLITIMLKLRNNTRAKRPLS